MFCSTHACGTDFRWRARVPNPRRTAWFALLRAITGTAIRVELWCDSRREARCRRDGRDAPHRPGHEPAQLRSVAHQPARGACAGGAERGNVPAGRTRVSLFTTVGRRLRHQLRRGRPALRLSPRHLPSAAAIAQARQAWPGLQYSMRVRAACALHAPACASAALPGHAVDNAAHLLARRGIAMPSFRPAATAALSATAVRIPWTVAIRHPRRAAEAAGGAAAGGCIHLDLGRLRTLLRP